MDWMLYAQALLGIVVFTALAVPFSARRQAINWRLVGIAIVLQFAVCILLTKVPLISNALSYVNEGVKALNTATLKGSSFVYGYLGGGDTPFTVTNPGALSTFAFTVLPLVMVVSALAAVLWHWRVLPLVVRSISFLFERTLGTRGPAGLAATATIFMGQVEAPLLVKPYVASMTRYELLILMTAGMSMISGSMMVIYAAMLGHLFDGVLSHLLIKSIMSVPSSILFAHILVPEGTPTAFQEKNEGKLYGGTMDAITRGTSDGMHIYFNICAILVVLIAFVALINSALGLLPTVAGTPLSLERVAGWIFAPIAWLMGIPWVEALKSGSLLGIKTVLNEFIAYLDLAKVSPAEMSERSRLITIYALCGFANFASVGMQVSGLAAMAPDRRQDLLDLGMPSLLAATLGSCMTGAIVGLVTF